MGRVRVTIMPDPFAFMRSTCDLLYLWTCPLELGQVVDTQAQDLTFFTLHRYLNVSPSLESGNRIL